MMKQPVRTNVSDFIKSTMGSQFVIPVYQRNYTWSPEAETARFMNDINALLEDRKEPHFLGILIYKEFERGSMYREIRIVDGQQRLTTSFLFLVCLKKIAEEKKDMETIGIVDDFYLYNRHASEDIKLRLKPTVSDDDTYERLLYGGRKDLSRKNRESNIYRNYEYIYQRLKEMNRKYRLLEILDTLSRLDILAFPLSEQDNSQQIFESINSTGAPLTSADLIRNYILMNDASDVQERNYRLYWQPLERYFPQSRKLEEFFRVYLAAKTYSYLRKQDVYEEFKNFWNSSEAAQEERLQEINRYCRYYHMIYNGESEDPVIERTLKDYRRNESRIPAPFLMEMFRLYDDEVIDARTLCAQIRLIDTYLTRRALCGMDNGSLNRYFPQLLRSVMNSWKKKHRNIHEITKVFLINYNRGKSLAMPTDMQLKTRLREINAYSLICIRPVLERIEHFGATAEVDTSDLNIEHIMPQNPNPWWKRNSGAADEEEYTFYANLIGNLTLCAEYDNTRMGNQDFQFKKSVLRRTLHIRMNTELLNRETWTVEDILKRCDRLARQIAEIYPYEGGTDTSGDERDDDIILLTTSNVNARAVYVNPQCVEILTGSTMRAYRPNEMKSMRIRYQDMSEKGILFEDENGQATFDKNFRFSDLNTAAQFLLHRGGDNTSFWTRENGTVFLQKKEPAVPPKKPESISRKASARDEAEDTAHAKRRAAGQKRISEAAENVTEPEENRTEGKSAKKKKAKGKTNTAAARAQKHPANRRHTQTEASAKPQSRPKRKSVSGRKAGHKNENLQKESVSGTNETAAAVAGEVKTGKKEKKAEVRRYSRRPDAHPGLMPQAPEPADKKPVSAPGFLRSLFGRRGGN